MEAIDARVRALDPRLDLHDELSRLRRERKAVILAHYYQDDEIQDLADFTGDSLQLAQAARDTDAEVILFCGVHFMAETAKILNPSRTVVLPDLRAGCSLADSCPPQKLAALKAAHPDHVVVSYINCTAETKALSDWICTSSNARRVIDAIPADQKIIFAPDRNLGAWLMRETGREMLLWQGSCIVHETFSERKLIELRSQHPDAVVLAHPECEPEILRLADVIGSTFALLRATQTMPAQRFIVATEPGIIHQMRKVNPQKEYIPLPGRDTTCACNECPFMRLNTLEKMVVALRDLEPRIEMSEELRLAALKPLERMLALG
ncbi:MAG: quinolinate synthase NadA [Deltaproteobacteria bacterium]|nr:quinolinate synthase NadA [Deltaproteobacteria bacterium]MBK9371363.1 quinolinate synthase NadA [Deltaproteobacteria bacterium]MBK9645676.1 quinolinate synthase NadA [Deltaproteobacteria bacterium]